MYKAIAAIAAVLVVLASHVELAWAVYGLSVILVVVLAVGMYVHRKSRHETASSIVKNPCTGSDGG